MFIASCFASVAIPSGELGLHEALGSAVRLLCSFYPVPPLVLAFRWAPTEKGRGERGETGLLLRQEVLTFYTSPVLLC